MTKTPEPSNIRHIGVEEEMFLVDPGTRRLADLGDRVVESAPGGDVERELFVSQVEIQSRPQAGLTDLERDLVRARADAATAADHAGARLAAMATPVVADKPGAATGTARYEEMMQRFGQVARRALVCGTHVHVGVASDAEGVVVIDGLRAWLPVVVALSASSPLNLGEDTSFASWRSQVWSSWPSAGATEPFVDVPGYRRAIESVVATGAALDEGMIYLDARLARDFPTVEVRVADACTDVRDTVLVAAVIRALVDTVAEQQVAGPTWRVDLLRAARWRASRYGLSDALVDPHTGRLSPARDVLAGLLDFVEPSLERTGDREVVREGLDRLLSDGTGADRQRQVLARTGRLTDVVDDVLRRTVGTC